VDRGKGGDDLQLTEGEVAVALRRVARFVPVDVDAIGDGFGECQFLGIVSGHGA
jgi:hypothetical protein